MKRRICLAIAIGLCLVPLGLRAGELEVVRDVTYVERQGQPLKADVYMPPGDGPFPGVLVVHGGGWRAGSKNPFHHFADRLAEAGFTSVAIDYRLAPEHKFPAQIEDCKAAVRWMRTNAKRYKIDPQRIGAIGYSAGGHLVALLGATDSSAELDGPDADGTSSRADCVVAGGAPCDFRLLPADVERLAYWLGGTRGEKPDVYKRASPLAFVTKDDPPMLFFNGDSDRLVPIFGARAMVARLSDLGVEAKLYTVEGAGHARAVIDDGAWQASVEFLRKHLQAGGEMSDM